MEYKGYNAVVTYDNDLGILHGEVIDTRDVITFQGKSVDDLQNALRRAVDDYLKFCEERGREPDKPFSGKVALRMDPETHRTIVGAARTSGKSLNTWILDAIGNELDRDEEEETSSWEVDETAVAAFQEFLKGVWTRGHAEERIGSIIPIWVDPAGRVAWTSDAEPNVRIFRFDNAGSDVTSEEYRLV